MDTFIDAPIKCGPESRYCVLHSGREGNKQIYTLQMLNNYFYFLVNYLLFSIQNHFGIRGTLRRPILHLFILATRVFVSHILNELNIWNQPLYAFYKSQFSTNDELDFEKIQNPELWNSVLDELIIQKMFMMCRVELVSIIEAIQDNDHMTAEIVFLENFITGCNNIRLLDDEENKQLLLIFAQNHPDFDNALLDDADIPLPNEEIENDQQNETIYGQLCSLLRNECSQFHMPHKSIMNGTYDTIDKCKGLILNGLLMPFMRYSTFDLDVIFPVVVCEESNFNYNTYCENFSTIEWVGGTEVSINGTLAEKLKDIKQNIMDLIEELGDDASKDEAKNKLEKMILSLKKKAGFLYSIHGLSYVYNIDLEIALHHKQNKKVVYKMTDLQKILSKITNSTEEDHKTKSRDTLIDEIIIRNPHIIDNAMSLYTDKLLFDIDNTLLLFYTNGDLNIGFDLVELITLINSKRGKNEISGLPDYPDLKSIWSGADNITDILNIVYEFLKYEEDEYQELRQDLITEVQYTFKETDEDIQDIFTNGQFKWCNIDNIDFLSPEKIPDLLSNERLLPLKSMIYYIEKNYQQERRQYAQMLKDINLLHIVGLLGWLMLSDNVSSHSQNANDFTLTNYCKGLFETYVMRLGDAEDEDNNQCFYTIPDMEYHELFNKKDILQQIMDLDYAGEKLGAIMNSATCLHGIGGQLIMVYLKSLQKLKEIKEEIGKPFYLKDDLLTPIPVFREIGNGYYIYAVNSYHNKDKNPDSLSSDANPFENYRHTKIRINANTREVEEEYYYFSVQVCHPLRGIRKWCCNAQLAEFIQNQNSNHRIFEMNKVALMNIENVENIDQSQLVNYFRSQESRSLLYMSDLYMKHRKEHFKVFLRYVIDFSNMLHEYADPQKGILKERKEGMKIFLELSEDVFTKHRMFVPYKSIDQVHYDENMSDEDLINFVMSRMYAAYYFSEEDLSSEFKRKFSKHLNVNATVGREYNPKLTKLSKLVYFHDILGNMASLFESKFRWKENNEQVESYYGFIGNERNVADKLVQNLMMCKGLNDRFNQMITSKAMISRIIMKFTDRNIINPHFYILNNDGEDNDDILYRQKLRTVSHFLKYINLNFDDVKDRNDANEWCDAYFKSIIYYIYFKTMVEVIIRGTAWIEEESPFTNYRRLLEQEFFESFTVLATRTEIMHYYEILNIYNEDTWKDHISIRFMQIQVKLNKEKIVNGLWKFMSLLFSPLGLTSYNYSIENMYIYEEYLKDIGTIINRNGGSLDELKRLVSSHKFTNDEKNLLQPFMKATGQLFPGDDKLLYHPGKFMSEMVDTYHKYDLMMTLMNNYFPRMEEIFNKIQRYKIQKIGDEEQNKIFTSIDDLLYQKISVQGIHYLSLINDGTHLDDLFKLLDINEPINDALNDEEKEREHEKRINQLFHILIETLFTYTVINIEDRRDVPKLLCTICALSYEHANRF
jgi:hypothetical protein